MTGFVFFSDGAFRVDSKKKFCVIKNCKQFMCRLLLLYTLYCDKLIMLSKILYRGSCNAAVRYVSE